MTMPTTTPLLDLRSYASEVHSHQHDYHQLVLPLAGQLDMSVEQESGAVAANQLAVIAAGKSHAFASSTPNRFLVADLPAALAPDLERLPAYIHLDPALQHYAQFLAAQRQQSERTPGTERQMLVLLVQLLQERFGAALQIDRRVETARRYLDQQFHTQVSLTQLAGIAHLSSRQLNELFRRQLGVSPRQYLTEKRMQHALYLLEHSDLSVQQIADRVGYSNLSAFSDRFRNHFGRSPRHYRSPH